MDCSNTLPSFVVLFFYLVYRTTCNCEIPNWYKGMSDLRTMQTELIRNGFCVKEEKVATKKCKPLPNKKESLSIRDIEDLMGTRRDTFKRVGGAIRRK